MKLNSQPLGGKKVKFHFGLRKNQYKTSKTQAKPVTNHHKRHHKAIVKGKEEGHKSQHPNKKGKGIPKEKKSPRKGHL